MTTRVNWFHRRIRHSSSLETFHSRVSFFGQLTRAVARSIARIAPTDRDILQIGIIDCKRSSSPLRRNRQFLIADLNEKRVRARLTRCARDASTRSRCILHTAHARARARTSASSTRTMHTRSLEFDSRDENFRRSFSASSAVFSCIAGNSRRKIMPRG